MFSKLLVLCLAALIGFLTLTAGGAAGTVTESPALPGVLIDLWGPGEAIKHGRQFEGGSSVVSSRNLKKFTLRLNLPGTRILKMYPQDPRNSVKFTWARSPGGVTLTFRHIGAGQGTSFQFRGQVMAPVGSTRCDSAMAKLANGESGKFKLGCHRITR